MSIDCSVSVSANGLFISFACISIVFTKPVLTGCPLCTKYYFRPLRYGWKKNFHPYMTYILENDDT